MTTALTLIFLAGVAEFLKDLSSEGKLKGYWDKNHPPMHFYNKWDGDPEGGGNGWVPDGFFKANEDFENRYWWQVHWLQGRRWDRLPVWIRQYLAFRDGWHLLKFFSVNLWALSFGVLASPESEASIYGVEVPVWLFVYVVIRVAFSTPETLGRIIYNKLK